MNKVFNINLGGYPFTIDSDAYDYLSKYLKTIHRHFNSSEGYEEITSDIEARMAELFQENLGTQPIVTLRTVEEAVSIMGTPEDFGAMATEEESTHSGGGTQKKKSYKTGKRLFRDPEDEVVAGVCSGVAAYFGIEDPLWVRLAFVVFSVGGGFAIPAYILLAVLVPKAKNSGDRLAMRGDAINVSNIANIVEEEFTNISERISEMTDNWDSKKKNFAAAAAATTTTDKDFRRPLEKGILALGKGIRHVLSVVPFIFKPFIFIIGFALIIAFLVIWILSIVSFFLGSPVAHALTPEHPFIAFLGIGNLAFLVGIPILSLALLAGRLVFKTKYNLKWSKSLGLIWALNIITLFGIGSYLFSQFSVGKTVDVSSQILSTSQNILNVSATENPYEDALIGIGNLDILGDLLISRDVQIHVQKTEGQNFQVEHICKSRGKNIEDATNTATSVQHDFTVEDNKIKLNPYFTLNKGEKWRNQHAIIRLYVPEGKSIKFDNLPHTIRHRIRLGKDGFYHRHYLRNGETWTMTEKGFVNSKHANKQNSNRSSNHKTIRSYELDKIEMEQAENKLSINTNLSKTSFPIRVTIAMPSLTALHCINTDDIRIDGFEEATMSIDATGEQSTEIKANIDVEQLAINLRERYKMDIRGSGQLLELQLKDRSKLEAEHFAVKTAHVELKNRSRAALAIADTLHQSIGKDSRIKVDGEPVIVKEN